MAPHVTGFNSRKSYWDYVFSMYRQTFFKEFQDLPNFHRGSEEATLSRFEEFMASSPRIFENSYAPGHLTGSALVVNQDFSAVVLTLHKKIKKWLQLGGHADGEFRLHDVALREAYEESGLKQLKLWDYYNHNRILLSAPKLDLLGSPLPIDFDIHEIPEHKGFPSHKHYDVRYLIVADDEQLVCSHESDDLRWFSLEEAFTICDEESMRRQLAKLQHLKRIAL